MGFSVGACLRLPPASRRHRGTHNKDNKQTYNTNIKETAKKQHPGHPPVKTPPSWVHFQEKKQQKTTNKQQNKKMKIKGLKDLTY